jgi:hypothetical protein
MRRHKNILGVGLCALLAGAALLFASAPDADAQGRDTTIFAVTYQQVANDCGDKGMTLKSGEVRLVRLGGKRIQIRIPGVEPMKGAQSGSRGKFSAQSQGKGVKPGLDAKYSARGKAAKGSIQMVFIAEFYQGKKPLCTQSWSARGARK